MSWNFNPHFLVVTRRTGVQWHGQAFDGFFNRHIFGRFVDAL
ncbi:Uncharacterised protein [Vibrio cholerae]|nr:Uncharacterised protein [Vibrio cholerae]